MWDCLLDVHGQGTKIHFPVKVRHFIAWSPTGYLTDGKQAPRAFTEKMSVDFIKVAA